MTYKVFNVFVLRIKMKKKYFKSLLIFLIQKIHILSYHSKVKKLVLVYKKIKK